jgi:hypothetical protein
MWPYNRTKCCQFHVKLFIAAPSAGSKRKCHKCQSALMKKKTLQCNRFSSSDLFKVAVILIFFEAEKMSIFDLLHRGSQDEFRHVAKKRSTFRCKTLFFCENMCFDWLIKYGKLVRAIDFLRNIRTFNCSRLRRVGTGHGQTFQYADCPYHIRTVRIRTIYGLSVPYTDRWKPWL